MSSLLNTRIEAVAGGLWHSVCLCDHGRVYTFGGNQFGQLGLGTGTDHTEVRPIFFACFISFQLTFVCGLDSSNVQ